MQGPIRDVEKNSQSVGICSCPAPTPHDLTLNEAHIKPDAAGKGALWGSVLCGRNHGVSGNGHGEEWGMVLLCIGVVITAGIPPAGADGAALSPLEPHVFQPVCNSTMGQSWGRGI